MLNGSEVFFPSSGDELFIARSVNPICLHRQVSFLQLSVAVAGCPVRDHPASLGGGVTLHAPEAQLHQPTWLTHCPSTLLSTSSGQSG